ncbi:MAG: SIMPL domain-containing protein [Chloroflexi bacterium]|nr:SIMPL domain-containing protein [Chloroflexota bacterium]
MLAALLATATLHAGPALAQQTTDTGRATVSVVGDGRLMVQPDTANVTFTVESTAQTLQDAQNDASTRMQAVINALVAQGIAKEDIRTSRVGITPIYDQKDSTILRGYRATNSVQVTMHDLDRVGTVVDAATAAGANRVDGISFSIADLTPPKDQARTLAMTNARAKADQLASLVGMRISGVKSIVESDASATPVRAPAPTAAAARDFSTPVEPGQQEVRTQVTVVYFME